MSEWKQLPGLMDNLQTLVNGDQITNDQQELIEDLLKISDLVKKSTFPDLPEILMTGEADDPPNSPSLISQAQCPRCGFQFGD